MKYQLLQELLPLLANFEEQNPNANMLQFLEHAKNHFVEKHKNVLTVNEHFKNIVNEAEERTETGETLESIIAKYLIFMQRYAKLYFKYALQDSPITGYDDFTYLITLYGYGELTKMELIEKNLHEKSTGLEIIKRLIDKGLIAQRPSESDKRSKVLNLSAEGLNFLVSSFAKASAIVNHVCAPLNGEEKLQLLRLLQLLNNFHRPFYDQKQFLL
ncbi:MAG: MarR family winged helix-turn-helix transcriptional regulator [Chitinophagaceae bacterium]|jgi:DNA-binding MarR family transcriptional regulator